ncbi:MAG: phosphoglycolate phosphatase [Candidatus Azotimanducaceae bacterium]|jgi:phosphoglycolate phosphatase
MEAQITLNITQKSAVLFDFDGTLAPNLDLPDMRRQVLALTKNTGVPTEVYAQRYIVEVIDVASAWLKNNAAKNQNQRQENAQSYYDQAHQLILDIEMQAAARTDPFPEARDYLLYLRTNGIATAVVTRNCRAAVLQTFPDILSCVDGVFARDDVTYLKPDPRHLLQALTSLGCEPSDSIMVGDGKLDMDSGKQLNMHCVGVLTGSSTEPVLLAAGAHKVVARFSDFKVTKKQL